MGTITERLLEEEFKNRIQEANQARYKVEDVKDELRSAEHAARWKAVPLARFLQETGPYQMYGLTWKLEPEGIVSRHSNGDISSTYSLPLGWQL